MTPKAKKSKITAVVKESIVMQIADVDLTDASGWRPKHPERVEELKKEFLLGSYGLSIMADPALRFFNGALMKGATSGKPLLADGIQKSMP